MTSVGISEAATLAKDSRPARLRRDYDRTELAADGVVHAFGVGGALIGAIALAFISSFSWPILIYAVSLVTTLGLSAAYNMWPVSPRKWLLRRFDHSAIYLLIAATYTVFVAHMNVGVVSVGLFVAGWMVAAIGITLKLAFPGRFDRLSIALYLLLGWSGVVDYHAILSLPSSTLWLLAAGGVLYSTGVIFHVWRSMRFQNAIWHVFVLLAASCHYAAVLDFVVRRKT